MCIIYRRLNRRPSIWCAQCRAATSIEMNYYEHANRWAYRTSSNEWLSMHAVPQWLCRVTEWFILTRLSSSETTQIGNEREINMLWCWTVECTMGSSSNFPPCHFNDAKFRYFRNESDSKRVCSTCDSVSVSLSRSLCVWGLRHNVDKTVKFVTNLDGFASNRQRERKIN